MKQKHIFIENSLSIIFGISRVSVGTKEKVEKLLVR